MDSSQNIDGFENPLSEFEGFGRTRRTRTDEATDLLQGRYNLFKTGCATHFIAPKSGRAKCVISLLEGQKVGAH